MDKLRLISKVMVGLGCISLLGGISINMKELMEFGLCIGIAGIVGYAATYIMGSTTVVEQESTSD